MLAPQVSLMSFGSQQTGDDPRIGTKVGDYDIVSVLGVGGMGKVYAANAPDGSRVALKLVKEDFARDETFRRRFSREVRIAQSVQHPNVVGVTDAGEHDGLPYLTEVFIDGGSLEDKIKREGRLDIPTMVKLADEVAAGLEALWAAGMVHRDVKPGNILLDQEGVAHLTDFGLAKDSQGSLLTLPGQALGSMDYMAPEQIRGEQVTAATDIYALGCVMWECLQGKPPFADRQGMRVLWAHLQDEPGDPCAGRDDAPPGFAQAVMVALRKDPSERPQTASAYSRALADAAGGAG
jgi:serine/threonine-protein kinase